MLIRIPLLSEIRAAMPGTISANISEGKEQPVKHEERSSETKRFFTVEHSFPPTFILVCQIGH